MDNKYQADKFLDQADRLSNTGIFLLRIAAGLFFLLPGLWKILSPADFQDMLAGLPDIFLPYQDSLFKLVAASEIFGGLVLILGFNHRLLIPPLVIIILAASQFVVRSDSASSIQTLSLIAHVMAAAIYVSLFFLGSGRWALDRNRDIFYQLSRRRGNAITRRFDDLVSGGGKNAGVILSLIHI